MTIVLTFETVLLVLLSVLVGVNIYLSHLRVKKLEEGIKKGREEISETHKQIQYVGHLLVCEGCEKCSERS